MYHYDWRPVKVKLTVIGMDVYRKFYGLRYGINVQTSEIAIMSITKLRLIFGFDSSFFEVLDQDVYEKRRGQNAK